MSSANSKRRMTTAPAKSRSSRAAPPEPPAPFATGEELGPSSPFDVATLPQMKRRVHVRLLDAPDVGELEMMPDLTAWMTSIRDLRAIPDKAERVKEAKAIDEATPFETRKRLGVEYLRWQARLLHIAVLQDAKMLEDEACADPDCDVEHHPPSLWSVRQCRRLHPDDREAVLEAALRNQAHAWSVPFSSDQTPSAMPPPAASGG